LSDQSGAAAHDASRDLPDRLSLRHSKLEAKRRLAAGEFATLHDAQLAVAREHGLSSWAALKERIAAAEAEHGHALAQVRWVFDRYGEADEPGWTAPDRDELSEHIAEDFLTVVPPQTAAAILRSVAPKLREDLVVIDAGPLHLRGKVADLLVEADAEPEAPHRLTRLGITPGGAPVTDARVAQPPAESFGPVPAQVPGFVEDCYAELGLVGLTVAGDRGSGPAGEVWACSRGWADLERNVPLNPSHRFPVLNITALITATAVLCLVAQGAAALDDPVNAATRCSGSSSRTSPERRSRRRRPGSSSSRSAWPTRGSRRRPRSRSSRSRWRTLLPGELAEQALRPHVQQFDSPAEIGLGWLLNRPDDVAGHAGAGPGSSVSLITRPSTGRTSVVLTNRQVLVEPTNARLLRLTA
jgi:hypothetical protein